MTTEFRKYWEKDIDHVTAALSRVSLDDLLSKISLEISGREYTILSNALINAFKDKRSPLTIESLAMNEDAWLKQYRNIIGSTRTVYIDNALFKLVGR